MPPTLWLGTGRSPSGYALVLGLEELTGRPHVVSIKDELGKWADAEETLD